MRSALLLALLCIGAPWRAMAQPFDGDWTVLQVCEVTHEGARGYTWRYAATVKDGYFAGQYRTEGQSPSMSLKGLIKADGTASLVARGISGDSDHNLKFAPAASPIAFEVAARFAGTSGTGERLGSRACKFTFSKVR
ncbi:MAG: hypothetical protein JSS04_02890 [Proteobacteria bacterium]|nr:hypothetical protein [Pseudomonadota bacterium]